MRKPNSEIYKYVLNEHDLQNAHYSLMKKENTDAALLLGLQVWNLQVGKEDVVDLFKKTYHRNPLLKK
jgi:putative hydrolase of the HAD superfamily